MKNTTWTLAIAGVMVGCATTPSPRIERPPATQEWTESDARAFEDAAAVFARHEAAGEWDGEACRESLRAFERVQERRRGTSARAFYMSGLTADRCGNEDGARAFYERALSVDAELCEPHVALGLHALERGQTEAARGRFERAVQADVRCAPAFVNLAILQRRDPALRDEALANLRRALAVRADYLPALDQMALLYLDGAEETPRMLDLAAMVCRQAQLVAPDHAPLYNTWALVDIARGDLTGAAAKLERAISLDPAFYEALMNFGQLTLSQRAYGDAQRAFAAARRVRPTSYDAALGEGIASRGLDQPEAAERLYLAALELDADRPEAFFDLAVLYHEHRDGTAEQLAEAERYLGEFVRRARGDARFADTVADVLRWCDAPAPGRRARAVCRPGRAQTIHQSLVLLGARPEGSRPALPRN